MGLSTRIDQRSVPNTTVITVLIRSASDAVFSMLILAPSDDDILTGQRACQNTRTLASNSPFKWNLFAVK